MFKVGKFVSGKLGKKNYGALLNERLFLMSLLKMYL